MTQTSALPTTGLRWYGGKRGSLGQSIRDLIPPHTTYIEPFGGGAAILMAKQPSELEVLNDINGDLITFYRVLRDPEKSQELIRMAYMTPYSRKEFETARTRIKSNEWDDLPKWKDWHSTTPNDMDRAWCFFVSTAQSFAPGAVQASWGMNKTTLSNWLRSCNQLTSICTRLQNVIVEYGSWQTIFTDYDNPESLFYLDPPYITSTRKKGAEKAYKHEFSDLDQRQLVDRIKSIKGMVLLSGYDDGSDYGPCRPYRKLESDHGWTRIEIEARAMSNNKRIEVVWINPECQRRQSRQGTLI